MLNLKVKENKIVDSSGKDFLIKGININSPGILKYQEAHDFLQDIKEIKKLGANAVRIPICPAYWQSKKNYCREILNPIVKLTKKLKLYCCLDWHAQGNPYKNETREPNQLIEGYMKYDARKEIAFEALRKLSKLYGKENHIIFEVFSMPIDIKNEDWIRIVKEFVEIIRKNSKNIIIVQGTNWASDLSWVLDNPIEDKEIVYGFNYYPLDKSEQNISVILKVKEKYPVIFPECGYTPEGYFKGTKENYAIKLKKYIFENNIGFFAWAYHPKRVPIILNSWNPNDLTEWGRFLKEELL